MSQTLHNKSGEQQLVTESTEKQKSAPHSKLSESQVQLDSQQN